MENLDIMYFSDTDTLSLWNGRAANTAGDLIYYEDLMAVVDEICQPYQDEAPKPCIRYGEPVDVLVDYEEFDSGENKVAGFTIQHAAELLLRPLQLHAATSEPIEINGKYAYENLVAGFAMDNNIPRTDYALSLTDGVLRLTIKGVEIKSQEIVVGEHEGNGFKSRLTAYEGGAAHDCVGFELTCAVEALLPHLEFATSGETPSAAGAVGA